MRLSGVVVGYDSAKRMGSIQLNHPLESVAQFSVTTFYSGLLTREPRLQDKVTVYIPFEVKEEVIPANMVYGVWLQSDEKNRWMRVHDRHLLMSEVEQAKHCNQCGGGLGSMYYGDGNGRGQFFVCEPCMLEDTKTYNLSNGTEHITYKTEKGPFVVDELLAMLNGSKS